RKCLGIVGSDKNLISRSCYYQQRLVARDRQRFGAPNIRSKCKQHIKRPVRSVTPRIWARCQIKKDNPDIVETPNTEEISHNYPSKQANFYVNPATKVRSDCR